METKCFIWTYEKGNYQEDRKKGKSEISQFSVHILFFVVVKPRSLKSVAYVASEGSLRNKDRILAEIP